MKPSDFTPFTEVDMSQYELEPATVIERVDGTRIMMYRSKTNPNVFLPVMDEGVLDFTRMLSRMMNEGELTK